ncbi:MAG: 16S rRNA (uracil(1498)-N(3))-methyltransferase [Lachnospiraceae bacterium]|nr:16S rRNA (uracil(1498)-N(3))-methyltransferase [Lachnospiraceae bacterium]
MYQFFVDPDQINEKTVVIRGNDYNHIKNVLRMKIGEEVNISNGIDSKEYRCAIKSFEEDSVILELRFIKEDSHELSSKVYLFQGLPKSDKMEGIIQKNIELGAFEIIPVSMKRCVVKLDEKKAANKVSRWQSIAEAAAKQSKRGIIPCVKNPMSFQTALSYAKENCDVLLLPYEMAEGMDVTRNIIGNITKGQNVAVFIGPEGGFDDSEVQMAKDAGFLSITLGKRILRTETAGMCVMSILMYQLENGEE